MLSDMLKFVELVCCILLLANLITTSTSSGFDSIECDPHSSRARTGRARLIASIPCDLTKQSYCNLPGEFYPWNAVKKFVYENQGLVRRMYGDMRHIFVMQSELSNEVDYDDIQHTADKYSKAFNMHNQRQMKAKKDTIDRKNFRSETEPYFRPAQRPSAINSKQKTKPPKITSNEQTELLLDNLIKSNVDAITEGAKMKDENSSSSGESVKTTILTSVPSASTTPSSLKKIKDEYEVSDHLNEINTTAATTNVKNIVINLFSNISSALSSSSTTSTISSLKTSPVASSVDDEKLSTTSERNDILEKVEELEKEIFNDIEQLTQNESEPILGNEDGDRKNTKEPQTTTTETQLFQDTVQKDKEPTPVVNRRGVNACPVKEEVVAPFWGNNTRGEILALLNVYPFEQYINWEKCTHEHEQMYCRHGCKCEQQYRLHRLLAYNPMDACRGIFSDWFRFPSCCICKCYDIPFDYRVTSRSPRGSEKILQEAHETETSFSLFDEDDDENFFDDPE
ncbi:CLUMA_CG007275, isoform A [Clunio marinus]|uniref:CLUMA_CG007275, isoform A n=1 Tax=Clunio marinus TaxID=568069 RepID=A0A1J1I0M2_9DIPT|nr:CLUMA_CG007275, isoform A [Clunio marinus]